MVDLGGFATQAESRAAALAVLDHLWENREQRIGRLIVIDEAHNLCTPEPVTPVEKLLTERIVQIAAEGRKYGLWLLLSTQRPVEGAPERAVAVRQPRPHAHELPAGPRRARVRCSGMRRSRCWSARRPSLQGQALFAGGFVDQPSLVQMGARMTHEGGTRRQGAAALRPRDDGCRRPRGSQGRRHPSSQVRGPRGAA